MGQRYDTLVEGKDGWTEWSHLKGWKERVACCSCCLVHDWEFRVSAEGQLYYRVSRNMRATAQLRRKRRR